MEWQLEVLSGLVKADSSFLGSFYLAGGTALALQLRHRVSEDLDFFSMRPLTRLPAGRVGGCLEVFGEEARRVFQRPRQEDWLVRGVRVTFVADPFPPVYPLRDGRRLDPSSAGLKLASPQEVALMKAYAMGRRATVRDFFDLYVLFSRGLADLGETIRRATEKYRHEGEPLFGGKLFLEQLVHPEGAAEDARKEVRVLEGKGVTLEDMCAFFRDLVAQYLRAELGHTPGRGLAL